MLLSSMDESEFGERLGVAVRGLSFPVEPETICRLARFAFLLTEWNRKFNLTRIESPDELIEKHFLDSLHLGELADPHTLGRVIDVGTGAGFPGMVLKIAWPHLEVTLLDAVAKKLRFLERVGDALGLTGLSLVHARAEDAAAAGRSDSLRERFDVVTARAVAPMNVLAEWTLPLAQVGGRVLAMKGPQVHEELELALPAIRRLGGEPGRVVSYDLPWTGVRRAVAELEKRRTTPAAFPRPAGSARKRPL